ncbi:hypothetical protein WJX81_001997 [Elliptochloris bilobata]|uniref:monodehydroascorbate reductase (NADH) n=1 Tax=Elliptochloris bilobata TaxID=381761 RepID=A0AAW1S3T5_9CHLO
MTSAVKGAAAAVTEGVAAAAQKTVGDAQEHYRYVIVGGGVGAGYAAAEFAECGLKANELCIISSDQALPYERPALSKGYLKPSSPARLPNFHTCANTPGAPKQTAAWYFKQGIDVKLKTRVTSVDIKGKSLEAEAPGPRHHHITWDNLVIATGSKLISMDKAEGSGLKGIVYLRTVGEADDLVQEIQECKSRKGHCVVIGASYIGMECGASVAPHGIDVTMVASGDRLFPRLFTPEISTFYEDEFAKHGIKIIKNDRAERFVDAGNGRVGTVVLKSGTKLPCSLCVVGVGVKPEVELFKGKLPLADSGGIQVDGSLRPVGHKADSVYVIGDAAAFPLLRRGGDLQNVQHVQHARESAQYAVQSIMGKASGDYDYLPFFYSREFDLGWKLYGDQAGEPVYFGDKAEGKFGCFFVKDGKVLGVFAEGASDDEAKAMRAVADLRPSFQSKDTLARQGLDFATKIAEADHAHKRAKT